MNEIVKQIRAGDIRALARSISMVESNVPGSSDVVRGLSARGNSTVVGITGPPGSGKSTLSDQLIERWRARDQRVGVLAVDPSSPFSGGALLGDRVRMQRHHGDSGVFIRSMAARGHLGGLAMPVHDALRLLAASGREQLLVETVGVGQSELEIMKTADTTIVVLSPATGDGVQIMKAGILEIADVFVVNKAELPDADKVVRELRDMIRHAQASGEKEWTPPIVKTTATKGEGVDTLVEALDAHHEHLVTSGELGVRRRQQLQAEVEAIVVARVQRHAREALEGGTIKAEIAGDPDAVDPRAVADLILAPGKTLG